VHFDSKNTLSGPPGGSKNTDAGNCFAPSASFYLLFRHKCPFSNFLTQHASFWRLYHPTRAPNIRITFSNSHFCSPFSSTCNHFHSFFEKMLPASVGITFLQVNPVHFASKTPLSGPSGGGNSSDVGNCFAPSVSF
jgi:hypothetical protein